MARPKPRATAHKVPQQTLQQASPVGSKVLVLHVDPDVLSGQGLAVEPQDPALVGEYAQPGRS